MIQNRKRLAYISNTSCHHSTEQHVMQSLISLGHSVIPIQENKYTPEEITNIIFDNPTDGVLYTRTWGLPGRQMMALWDRCKRAGIPTISYHLDLYYGLARTDLNRALCLKGIRSMAEDPFWKTEYCFTVDGDPEAQKYFESLGINHYFLRAGVFDKECYIAPREDKYEIIFVGSYNYHLEWNFRPQLIDWLYKVYGSRFTRFGNPAPDQPSAIHVRNDELNKVYASSKIVIGDSLNPGFCKPYYSSDRIYETLGRGGFLIYPYIKGLDEEFDDQKHLIFYSHGNLNDLKEKIDYWVDPLRDEEREKIRLEGHLLVKNNYTYKDRMAALMGKVFGLNERNNID